MATLHIPDPVAEVLRRLREIGAALDPRDGIAWCNAMRMRGNELIAARIAAGCFADPQQVDNLETLCAQAYFAALAADDHGVWPNPAWHPVFDARANRTVWPLQFALAGMNAHLNHDLPLAVTKTGADRHVVRKVIDSLAEIEAELRAEAQPRLRKLATRDAEALEHILAGFSVAKSRDTVSATVEILWAQRDNGEVRAMTERALEQTVATTGRILLTPVVPPPN
ncbi:hypothetical protein D5S18_21530 [Nocardia panacis]|uniref:Uncharacterized protein n=1 Tax=Nocardia panacis TaxID=2340916 RepID=A0A3A4JUK0_9NOCA|nr:DUF5995 family protein [Nocardia panacis]RJO73746.1 hypothetical protein D5S18_21530 [Nocardia panacis]